MELEVEIITDDGTPALTVTVITLLVAIVGGMQVELLVKITLTWSPLFNVLVVKTGLFVPVLLPFTCHW